MSDISFFLLGIIAGIMLAAVLLLHAVEAWKRETLRWRRIAKGWKELAVMWADELNRDGAKPDVPQAFTDAFEDKEL